MDYEKEYKEALEKAKAIYQGVYKPDTAAIIAETLQSVFPELKESEDERIRKEIICFLRNIPNSNYTCEEMAAWLEAQGEQKSHAWSEEDDQYLLVCKNALRRYQTTDKWDAEIISFWLENKLKAHQTSWKPSDEQMEALWEAYKGGEEQAALASLYSDLKKL